MNINIYSSLRVILIIGLFMSMSSIVNAQDIEDSYAQNAKTLNEIASDEEAYMIIESSANVDSTESSIPKIGPARVSIGQGWAISQTNQDINKNSGELLKVIWVTKQFNPYIEDSIAKDRQNYGENSEAYLAALKQKSKDLMIRRGSGFISLGFGNEKSEFIIKLESITKDTLKFIVYDAKVKENSVGYLEINAKQYSDIALWSGKLTLLNSISKYKGEYFVSFATKSRLINDIKKDEQKVSKNIEENPETKKLDSMEKSSSLSEEEYSAKKIEAYKEYQNQRASGEITEEFNSGWARFWDRVFNRK